MGKTKTKSRSVGDSPKPPITIRSTNVKILDDNIAKLEKAIQASDVSANPSGTAEETLLSTIGIDGKKYDLGPSAENTSYDNTDSGLTADNVQAAIDEVLTDLNGLYIAENVSGPSSLTVTANSYNDYNINVSKTGYTALGVLGFQINGGARLATSYCGLSATNNVKLRFNNYLSDPITIDGVTVTVLYKKN